MLGSRAILYASRTPPSIIIQPSNVTTLTDTTTTFRVSCSGPDLTYKWYISNIEIITGNVLNVGTAYTTIPATSTVYVVISNRFGSVTSINVNLTVNMPPFNILPDLTIGAPGLLVGVTNFDFDDIKPQIGKIPDTENSIPRYAYCYANGGSSPFTFEFYIGSTKITDVSPTISYNNNLKKYFARLDLSDPKLSSGISPRPRYSIVSGNLTCKVTDRFGRQLTSNIVNYSNYGPPANISLTNYVKSTKFVSWNVTNYNNTKCFPTSFIVLDSAYPNGNVIQVDTDTGYNNIVLDSKSPTGSTRKIYLTDGISVSNAIDITV